MRHGWTVVPALVVLGVGLIRHFPAVPRELPSHWTIVLEYRQHQSFSHNDAVRHPGRPQDRTKVGRCMPARGCKSPPPRTSALKGIKLPAMVAARRAVDEEMSQWLITNLSPEQLDRLDQIDLQWEGPAAMITRPFYEESLSLTREQREKLTSCLTEARARRAQGTWTYEDHHELTRKALAVLSEKQRHLWVRILGEPCAFKIGVSMPTPAARVSVRPAATVTR